MFSNKKNLGVLICGSLLFLAACGDQTEEAINKVLNEPDLTGRYLGPCQESELTGLSARETLRFEVDGGFSRYQDYYTSDDCSGDNRAASVEVSGTFSVDNDGAPDSEGGSMKLEITDATIQTSSDVAVAAMNAINFCGANDYEVGKEVEVTSGSDDALCPVKDVPDTLYGVYREVDGDLYLNEGGFSAMSDEPEGRPNTLATDVAFSKD